MMRLSIRAGLLVLLVGMVWAIAVPARAADGDVVKVGAGISYQAIGRYDVDALNKILTTDTPAYFGQKVAATPARNAVRLYRVTYGSVVPELGNRPITATGLLAVPEVGEQTLPILSYQHGTVFQKTQVPSFPDQSHETQLVLAQFAGQGYVVIGADYFGMGGGAAEPEAYLVKASHQQASFDLLTAARAVLAEMGIATPKLFIAGWSQGGYATMAFLERLEAAKVPVQAAATASAGVDLFVGLSGFLDFPRANDANWIGYLYILSAFAYDHYYGVPGLARSVLTDEAYDIARKAYTREPYDMAQVPADLHKLIRAEYFDPAFFAASAYGRLLADKTQAYRWIIASPARNYYGEADEVISVGLGRLAETYQRAIGAGNPKVEAVSTGPTDHRGTFLAAVPQWKAWFDSK